MAPKKKAEKAAPKDAPAPKKAKTEEKVELPKKDEPKAMEVEKAAEETKEEEKEPELDDKTDNRPALKDPIIFDPAETTLNVLPCGKVLMSLTEGGMQYLIAGARTNIGMKSGRYFFEVKVIQFLYPADRGGNTPKPRNILRIGFSCAGTSLLLTDSEESICFDGEGFCFEGKLRKPLATTPEARNMSGKFGTVGQVVGVLLNLDDKSPNASTISLFKDGVRVAAPRPLPENLKGKTLFPHVSFRNVSVQVNFGPTPLKALPFKCRLLGSAAKSDTAAAKLNTPKDGKYELLLPVAFPDEGTFDWLDTYLEENPKYVELSDRKIIDWAKKSGLYQKGGGGWKQAQVYSNDKPNFNFNVPGMDDFSVKKLLNSIAPLVPRNYVVMEVRSNLMAEERKTTLGRFNYPQYKKVAHVVMGEPDDKFKEKTWERLLTDKQKASDAKFRAVKMEEKRKKILEKRKKDLEKAKAKADKLKKKADEAKKKEEEEKKAKDAEAKKEGEEKKDEEKKEEKEEKPEEKKEEPAADSDEEEEKDEPMEEEKEEDPPTVELTAEDKEQLFVKKPVPDLAPSVMSLCFGKFSTPEDDEGFDEIRYEWQPAAKAKDYLKTWVQEKKLSQRIENLVPGEKAKTRIQNFKKAMSEWMEKHSAHQKKGAAGAKEAEKAGDVDIFAVENISDVGGGVPLYKEFGPEDWVLLQLRFDLHHLTKAFKEDTNDPERIIHEDHILFYYQKYYYKPLNAKPYGLEKTEEVLSLVKETVTIDATKKAMTSTLEDSESFDIYVKLTEESRRERQRRIDAGDETARLNFSDVIMKAMMPKPEAKAAPKPEPAKAAPKKGDKGETKGKETVTKGEGKGKFGAKKA